MENNLIHLPPKFEALTTLSPAVIIREQDKSNAVKGIALLLTRLSKLYQIPGWAGENSVILAEWICDNYPCEEGSVIESVLKNPPTTPNETNWRLTPDTITKWMTIALEKKAAEREKEATKFKEGMKDELPEINYEEFKKRLNVEALPNDYNEKRFHKWGDDPKYQEFRNRFITEQFKKQQGSATPSYPPVEPNQNDNANT